MHPSASQNLPPRQMVVMQSGKLVRATFDQVARWLGVDPVDLLVDLDGNLVTHQPETEIRPWMA